MKIIIFGKTNKDKGTQLEQLTKSILTLEGYTDIVTNILKSGGEIDVCAYYDRLLMGRTKRTKVICECKAIEESIDISTWYKFIGKLHVELISDESTEAVMIALSGANGYVRGAYDEIKNKRNNIRLISGDDLEIIIKSIYNIIDSNIIATYISNYANRHITSFEIAYYNNEIYWVLLFNDGAYTMLNKDSSFIEEERLRCLRKMIEKNKSEYAYYIDIKKESEYNERCAYIDKFSISFLIEYNKPLSYSELLDIFKIKENVLGILNVSEIELANILIKNEFVDVCKNICSLKKIENEYLPVFLRYIVNDFTPIEILKSDLYQQSISGDLLKAIIQIQNNIIIPEDKIEDCLLLLRHSPTAMAYALSPDRRITEHRFGNIPKIFERVDRGHTEMFIKALIDGFINDYQNKQLHSFYFNDSIIKGLKINRSIEIDLNENIKQMTSETGLRIGKLDEQYNNQLVMLVDLPE